ncbi:MAG: alpha/beta hydrolase family protein, partial [Candidatus Binatia bacterium]
FDSLGLVGGTATSTLAERVDELAGTVVERARHFALRVAPPNDLGPTAAFGPHPVGVMTLNLNDPARLNTAGDGPRPLTVEVYYPSTAAAIDGVPKDIVNVLGVPVVETPAYRDVALDAAAPHPMVLFSHGNNGLRVQSFFFAAHLASHGYIVVTPDHHGNTFVDTLARIIDPQSPTNRPLDMSLLIDRFLAFNAEPGNFFAGAIDADAIGMSGHSFGGYTTFALAGGPFALGTFTEPRIKAIFPQAPAAIGQNDAFFATITVPTLIVGGSIDGVTPPGPNQQRPFDHLPAGASIVGYANITGGGHFTFSDFCEVPRTLLGFLGGFEEACEPRHLPWRHAHDIINYLALNFFDATLRADPAARARLDPTVLNAIEDLTYQSK